MSTGTMPSKALERHYSPEELGVLWSLSPSTIRRLFQDDERVLKIGKKDRRDGKRDYVTIRIPESVVKEEHERRQA